MPTVSVIVPVYNEEKTISLLLQALYDQSYLRSEMEIILADGMSTDGTRQAIDQFRTTHPDLTIRVIDNQKRTIPSALNLAIEAAQGEYIVRLDAHSSPQPDYVERVVSRDCRMVWESMSAVFGRFSLAQIPGWRVLLPKLLPTLWGLVMRSIATPRRLRRSTPCPLAHFASHSLMKLGLTMKPLLANEDYEFNTRVRQHGGTVWLDPEIKSTYFARPALAALAKQYTRYGYWKVRMLRRYPDTIRWRQALPPLFVFGLIAHSLLPLYCTLRWFGN